MSRNGTQVQLSLDGQVIYDKDITYAAGQSHSISLRLEKLIIEWLSVMHPNEELPVGLTADLSLPLSNALCACESKYGHNSEQAGDAEVVFKFYPALN